MNNNEVEKLKMMKYYEVRMSVDMKWGWVSVKVVMLIYSQTPTRSTNKYLSK
jgi:hypothetical protein